jgi:hypothetical protein
MPKMISAFIGFLVIILIPLNSVAATVYKAEKKPFIIASTIDVSGDEALGGKSPLLAMGLSFFIPGAGQVYNGEIIKGVVLFGSIVSLLAVSLLFIEPAAAQAKKLKTSNSLLDIAALVTRVGIPVLWVYNWGSAYQSADPVYQRKKKEEEKKKDQPKTDDNPFSNNFELNLLSFNF